MLPHPDNPVQVSVEFLKKLDADPPGTWLAQPKLDGWRRILVKGKFPEDERPTWVAMSKDRSAGANKPMPAELWACVESLDLPIGTALDTEWVGNRCKEDVQDHSLHVFDLLMWEYEWLRNETFLQRYTRLCSMTDLAGERLQQVMAWKNPGLVDLFQQQMQDPLSEGLVVRRADSKLILATNKCADNPMWFKVKYRNIKERIV